jgi:uncharacterized phage protein gp47/JayE
MAGLTASGFEPKTLTDIKADLEAAMREAFGASINLSPESNFGKLVGILADRYAELWEVAEGVYSAGTPDGATGAALDELAGLTGTVRLPAAKSTVTLTVTGTPGTVLPVGRVVSVVGTGARFVTTAEVTIGGGGTITVAAEAEDTGPTPAYAGTLTVIETPVGGWTSVTNALDAVIGRHLESDAALRLRREQELRAIGGGSVDAIIADLLRVTGVTAAFVFENTSSGTDSSGLPPKSIEAVVNGGADADILAALLASKPAGIETYAAAGVTKVSGVLADSEGGSHTVMFSRPTTVPVYLVIDVRVMKGSFPADGASLIKQKVADFGDATLVIGRDVVGSALVASVFEVPGVVDVEAVKLGTAPSPVATTPLQMNVRQVAALDTSRITVNVTDVTSL